MRHVKVDPIGYNILLHFTCTNIWFLLNKIGLRLGGDYYLHVSLITYLLSN